MLNKFKFFTIFLVSVYCFQSNADENLLGYVRGAETLPQGDKLHLVEKKKYETMLKIGFNF